MQVNVYNPINSHDNTYVIVSDYPELQKTVQKIIKDMPPLEACNIQFTLVSKNGVAPFTFGVKKKGFQPTPQDIIKLGAGNKYVRQVACTDPDGKCVYPVIKNFPRRLSRNLHCVVPITQQTTLTYGNPEYPIYDLENLNTPVVTNVGRDALSAVFARMQKEQVASK